MTNLGAPFPADLADLLRIACAQGKFRLNVWFGNRPETGRGYQVNLANSGNGWSVLYHEDALEGIAKVLRQNFGAMLSREMAGPAALPVGAIWDGEDEDGPLCLCGTLKAFDRCCGSNPDDETIREALLFVLGRRERSDGNAQAIAEAVSFVELPTDSSGADVAEAFANLIGAPVANIDIESLIG